VGYEIVEDFKRALFLSCVHKYPKFFNLERVDPTLKVQLATATEFISNDGKSPLQDLFVIVCDESVTGHRFDCGVYCVKEALYEDWINLLLGSLWQIFESFPDAYQLCDLFVLHENQKGF
jgi:hypothetical protein